MIIIGIAFLVEMALMIVFGWTGIDKLFLIDLAACWLTAVALMVAITLKLVS